VMTSHPRTGATSMDVSVARPGTLRSIAVAGVVLSVWLLLSAMPVLADGGPHVAGVNSGLTTLVTDSCARCHRAHTAQDEALLVESGNQLCLDCHGNAGTGATTNVEGGAQYALGTTQVRGGTVAGALRSGGFKTAKIDSAHSSRISYPYLSGSKIKTTFSSLVGVMATGTAVTSAHLDLDGANGVVSHGKAWGNGAIGSGAGPVVELSCTSCHNPHGNNGYRILNPIPTATGGGFVPGTTKRPVTDAALPTGTDASGTRNYTVQWGRTLADVTLGTYLGGTPDPLAGDYWRRWLPWDGVPGWNGVRPTASTGHEGDVPMYIPGDDLNNLESFRSEITLWCVQCHTRYRANGTPPTNSGDSVFTFRHQTTATECTQCHLSHGSNAAMGPVSGQVAYPDDSAATSYTTGTGPSAVTTYDNSRLLKIDNRGTCQACHDPTNTIPFDGSVITH
jgi:predicted CXXCH cytochrome family protein